MNKTLAFITALFVVVAFCAVAVTQESCNKVSGCGGLKCDNGGECGNGVCLCAAGYSGPSCDTPAYAQLTGTYIGTNNQTGNNVADTVIVVGVPGSPDSVTLNGLAGSFNLSLKLYIPPQFILFNGDSCSISATGIFTEPNFTYSFDINSINSGNINTHGTFTGVKH